MRVAERERSPNIRGLSSGVEESYRQEVAAQPRDKRETREQLVVDEFR
jgi:hypothetical protein